MFTRVGKGINILRKEDMNSKRVLKFYFAADMLNDAMDNLIEKLAINSREEYALCRDCASRICLIIEEKSELGILWGYLNGIIETFGKEDKDILKKYALRRTGISKLPKETKRDIHRVVTRFSRKAESRIENYAEGMRLVDAYYCLCG
jgi:hypothetical protein